MVLIKKHKSYKN